MEWTIDPLHAISAEMSKMDISDSNAGSYEKSDTVRRGKNTSGKVRLGGEVFREWLPPIRGMQRRDSNVFWGQNSLLQPRKFRGRLGQDDFARMALGNMRKEIQ